MTPVFELSGPLAANMTVASEDVLAVKKFLQSQGLYEVPEWGLTPYPDQALYKAIKAFQKAQDLRVDGIMKPDGETETAIRQQALRLQKMGQNGDTILAHITPTEAMMLKKKGGSGTVNPETGLLEFFEADKKKGKYIWHTTGDGRVRSSHAKRDGKVFSWDKPPEGGHPGEAPNCRCSAEDVKKKDCEKIAEKRDAAWERYEVLFEPVRKLRWDIKVTKKTLEKLRAKLLSAMFDANSEARPARSSIVKPKGGSPGFSFVLSAIRSLEKKRKKIRQDIEFHEGRLTKAEEQLGQLEYKRENHRLNWLEYDKRYKECVGKDGSTKPQ